MGPHMGRTTWNSFTCNTPHVYRSRVKWWADVRTTITTDKFVDVKNIHFFAPPPEFEWGGGDANGDPALKQGAYGKVRWAWRAPFSARSPAAPLHGI